LGVGSIKQVAVLPALAASPPSSEAVTLFFWLLSSFETLHQNFSPLQIRGEIVDQSLLSI